MTAAAARAKAAFTAAGMMALAAGRATGATGRDVEQRMVCIWA
jgi:hypothetical protein